MSHALSEKGFDCLLFIGGNRRDREYSDFARRYEALCDKWGEKVVYRMLESLDRRGYIDYGVAPPFGWLTYKGVMKLIEYTEVVLRPQIRPQTVENGKVSQTAAS
jgi:hypothetical protein